MTKKSKKWRGALIYLALFGVAPMSYGVETRYVSTYDELASAIAEYNSNAGDDFRIILSNDVILSGNLPAITGNVDLLGAENGSLKIEGNGNSINGVGTYRGLYIDTKTTAATVSVADIEFASCYAAGGNGGSGASGGGGGMGAGAAIFAYSGEIVLSNVTASNSAVKGGDGGSVLQESESYGGGGGLGGKGGNGKVEETGAANGGGLEVDGADSYEDREAGDGGVTSEDVADSFAHYVDKTTPVGGNSLAGGGGGASTALGGDGGFGGGGGAGGVEGGDGGVGGGGGGGSDQLTGGLGGFGAGNGGYVETVTSENFSDTQGGGVGGGGAALGAAVFVGEDANLTIAVSKDSFSEIYGGSLTAGVGGGGTAEDGETIGSGIFLLNDLTIEVAEGGEYYISDSIGGYAGASKVSADSAGRYENESGIIKTGEGTLYLNSSNSTYTGDSTVRAGKLVATQEGAISEYSKLNVEGGSVVLEADQTIKGLAGSSRGNVDLNGNVMTLTGDDDSEYGGTIVGDGLLTKQGSGTLTLSGDNRTNDSNSAYNTEIQEGTIRVQNEGAFGNGTIYYTRLDENDRTAAIEFGDSVDVANDIVLSGNSVPMILAGTSGTLSGQLTSSNSSANLIELRLNEGDTLTVANTGVTRDEEGNVTVANSNAIYAYALKTGNLTARVSSYSTTTDSATLRYWNSAIGNASLTNDGDNTLSFLLDTDNVADGLKFANNLILNSGELTIGQTLVDGDVTQVNKINYAGNTIGDGGLVIDIGDGATLYATGSLNHATTTVKSGVLNVAGSSDANVNLGKLSAEGGSVDVASKNLVVDFDDGESVFNGRIVGDGTTVYKDGTGAWTLNLTNDSNVSSIQIVAGTFSLGENHLDGGLYQSNDFEMELWSAGRFLLSTTNGSTLVLNNFIASSEGSVLEIGKNDELVLSGENSSTEISANLVGSGWLFLENVVGASGEVAPWVLNGDNSGWNGAIAAYDNQAKLTLASQNAASSNSTINFGAYGTLNVNESTSLGSLDFDNNLTINALAGKTLALNGLTSSVQWLDDSALTIDGGGSVALSSGAAKPYYGETVVTNGSSLVLCGDNTAGSEYGAYRRATTLTNGGALVLDYSSQGADGTWGSLWGSDVNIIGDGIIAIQDVLKLLPDENGNYSYYSGVVKLDDAINFVGEENNELTLQVGNSYATVELLSSIEGSGDLVKTGAGKLILNGMGNFKSAAVQSGTLQLGTDDSSTNDQLASSSVTVSGGVLAGWTDSLGSVNLHSGVLNVLKTGTVSLKDSGSALTMDGGTMYVNVLDSDNYTNYKTTDADSTATISGGVIYVDTSSAESELASGTNLVVVEASEGNLNVDKSKLLIYDDIVGKRFVVDPDSISSGKLSLLLKESRFSDMASSLNEKAVGGLLDEWIDSGTLDSDTNDFLSQLESEVANNSGLLNQLTGEMRLSSFKAQLQTHNFIRQTLTQKVLPDPTSGVAVSAIRGQAREEEYEGITGWMSALAAFGDADARRGTSGYDYDMVGGLFGIEVGNSASNQFGFYFSYSNTQVDADNTMGNVKLNEEIFGTYLRLTDAYGYTFATGSIGITDYDVARAISLQNYSNLYYKGSNDGWSGSAYLERGFTFSLPASDLQPYGGLQYTYLNADDFDEGGSLRTLSIHTDETDYNSLEGVLGIRWLKSTILGSRQFDVNAYANWTHEFLDASPEGFITLSGRPDGTIRVIGNSVGRDWVYAGLGGKAYFSDVFSVFGGADVQVNDYTTYVNGHVGLNYTW